MYYIMLIVCKKNSIEYVWVLDRVQRILAHMYLHRIYFKFHKGGIGRPPFVIHLSLFSASRKGKRVVNVI